MQENYSGVVPEERGGSCFCRHMLTNFTGSIRVSSEFDGHYYHSVSRLHLVLLHILQGMVHFDFGDVKDVFQPLVYNLYVRYDLHLVGFCISFHRINLL